MWRIFVNRWRPTAADAVLNNFISERVTMNELLRTAVRQKAIKCRDSVRVHGLGAWIVAECDSASDRSVAPRQATAALFAYRTYLSTRHKQTAWRRRLAVTALSCYLAASSSHPSCLLKWQTEYYSPFFLSMSKSIVVFIESSSM